MIVSLEGTILETNLINIVLDVQGVGYEVFVPLTTAEILPPIGSKIKLHTFVIYREDSQALYGFKTREDRDFFRLLVEKVSGIGPKIALSILSKLSVSVLQNAIAQGDISLLSKCPGIGKKTAERLTIELRDKVLPNLTAVKFSSLGDNSATEMGLHQDSVSALIGLGVPPIQADKKVRKALTRFKDEKPPPLEELIKMALAS